MHVDCRCAKVGLLNWFDVHGTGSTRLCSE